MPEDALETYIQLQDPVCNGACILDSFLLGKEDGVAAYAVFMVSQAWRAPGEVVGISGNNTWTHWLIVFIPDDPVTDTALLFINGESNDDPNPPIGETEFEIGARIAQDTRSVVAVLFTVPNQPLQFSTEAGLTEGLEEDALVAFTWDRAMRTGDWLWPAYSPMTKSAVRGMDAVQAFVPAITSGEVSVNDFVVTGFSKRGATTWLTAAFDERVIAIAPGVFDVLHFAPQAEHHLGVYGFFTSALDDFVNHDIPWRLRIPEGQDLRTVVDPFSYLDRLTLPKYLIHSSGDEFYTPDSARFYWSDLPGEKLIRYIPNSDHSLSHSETALETTLAGFLGWYKTVLSGAPRPEITWSLDEATGALVVETSPPALLARLWQATNPEARDFRLETLGEAWTESASFRRWGWGIHRSGTTAADRLDGILCRTPLPIGCSWGTLPSGL